MLDFPLKDCERSSSRQIKDETGRFREDNFAKMRAGFELVHVAEEEGPANGDSGGRGRGRGRGMKYRIEKKRTEREEQV